MPEAVLSGPIPETETSRAHVLEPYGLDRLAEYDYVQEEYLVEGTAAGAGFGTRILVRRPADVRRCSGTAITEVSHIWGGTSVWRAINRFVMRGNHVWVEIDSQAPSAMGLVAASDPQRYRSFRFTEGERAKDFAASIPFEPGLGREELAARYDAFMARWRTATPQSPEIIAAIARALRAGLPGCGFAARRIFFGGISQTGGVVREFIRNHHARYPVFDGYLPGASGGPALPDIDAPVIEVLGEAEFQSVREPCGVSGQVRGLSHRRADGALFRLYEVAGMAHRETRYMSAADRTRLAGCPLPEDARWSTFPNGHVYHALWQALLGWSEHGTPPPPGKVLETLAGTEEIARDEHGNALGGLRTTYTDVPVSTLVAATPVGRPSWYHGNETPFPADKLRRLYGDGERYRRAVAARLEEYIHEGTYLPIDAEEIRRAPVPVPN
ncbi:alpha/beta hydrolase domain-containing protein [Sciscionella sediminilitoris]|uniref:alpha/beta hydrolase domain-containing protein n=1 Tax=Sciscionella sediminilitoris TaxID=1445613 RepID=UPI0004DF5C6A|nr:alpha/beta hydrolase domain-containing protein [Sciscionella sp. SE31]